MAAIITIIFDVLFLTQPISCDSCTCADASQSIRDSDLVILSISESKNVCVCSQYEWSDTGIKVALGHEYEFEVKGSQTWIDYQVTTSADGYTDKWIKLLCCDDQWLSLASFESQTRVPSANWAALSCCAGRSTVDSSSCFIIGQGPITKRIGVLASAEDGFSILACFANDLSGLYGDNAGALNVTITRLV